MEDTFDEFLEDFGGPAPGQRELDSLLELARSTNNATLRRVLRYHEAVKHIADGLLDRLVEDGANDQQIKIARFILHGVKP